MADAVEQKIGDLLDSLGVTMILAEGDMVTDALVLMKVVDGEGRVSIGVARSEALDWITRLGLLDGYNRLEGNRFDTMHESDE